MGNRSSKSASDRKRYETVDHIPEDDDSDSDSIFLDSYDSIDSPKTPDYVRQVRSRLSTAFDDVAVKAQVVDHTQYAFPFENIVLEGGGNKGLAYCGAMKELEELGLMPQIKRFAGASAGAMTAALLCVGFSADEIRAFLSQDLRKVFLDHSCGYLSLLPNLLSTFGWNPGKRIFRWFGDRMHEATGNRDITFREVFEKFGKELCIVVTNLNQMMSTYCHVKSTPDMPITVAVRMSMAIPAMFSATKYSVFGHTDIFVDGGVLCNYPVHCYDGWWLSMEPKDSYLRKLQPLSKLAELYDKNNRFGTWNDKTLGFLLFADDEQEMYRTALESRRGTDLQQFPDTVLSRAYNQKITNRKKINRQHVKVSNAVDVFLKALKDHDVDENSTISLKELEKAFDDEAFTDRHRKLLFGKTVTAEEAFKIILGDEKEEQGSIVNSGEGEVENKYGMYIPIREKMEITYQDIVRFLENHGISLCSRFLGFARRDVKTFPNFLESLQDCLVTNVKRVYMEERDIDRTVGINTGYLGTTDFNMEEPDREYLVEQGRRATVSFLKYYVVKNNPPLKPEGATIEEERSETTSAQRDSVVRFTETQREAVQTETNQSET